MTVSTALELRGVTKTYGNVTALREINLSVNKGEFLTILGPSGSGKSTLLKIIGGFEEPDLGEVWINGRLINNVPPFKRPTSMVFQDLALFPHLNVFDNIAYGLKVRKFPREEIRKRVRWASELLHIENLLDRRITQLSGGQQQRVALARSLVLEPEVLLLDEPLGPLDLKLRREMQVELRRVQRSLKATWVYVTHDHEEAMTMSDRVAILNEGRLLAVGDIKTLYEKPCSRFVAEFLGDANFFEARISQVTDEKTLIDAGGLLLRSPAKPGLKEGEVVQVMIRPEKIKLHKRSKGDVVNSTHGKVIDVTYKGSFMDVKIETEQGYVMLGRFTSNEAINIGDAIDVVWEDEDVVILRCNQQA